MINYQLSIDMGLEKVSDEAVIAYISENKQDLEQGDRTGATLLWHAILCNRRELAKWLVKHGANVNAQNENVFSVLHLAVQERNVEMVVYLLQNGANVNIQDSFGNTPVMRTNMATPKEILHILLESGADVDLKNIASVSCRDISETDPVLAVLIAELK